MTGPVPPHGTRRRYARGCRCGPCRSGNAREKAAYLRRRARREWGAEPPALVDAEPVRAYVRELQDAGAGPRQISAAAGVGHGTVARLLWGERGQPPTRHVHLKTAERIMAVRAVDVIADGAQIDGAGTARRLQALVAVGWTLSELGRRLRVAPSNMPRLVRGGKVTAGMARRVAELYRELWDQKPPAETARQRAAAERARRWAAERGWSPPAGWDDDLIDLPEDELAAELRRRARAMSDDEVRACNTAYERHGDRSPLIVAGFREYKRRAEKRRAERLRRERAAAANPNPDSNPDPAPAPLGGAL